jgi:hypothetical protein
MSSIRNGRPSIHHVQPLAGARARMGATVLARLIHVNAEMHGTA